MTQFNKASFNFDGLVLTYAGRFVARFKYAKRDRAAFQAFLIKNFTVEEYFAALDADVAPQQILEDKGYLSTTIKKILKEVGYEPTRAGYDAYIKAQCRATYVRLGQPIPERFL